MINEIISYSVTCNNCGEFIGSCLTEEVAIELAIDNGWIVKDDMHFCSTECESNYLFDNIVE